MCCLRQARNTNSTPYIPLPGPLRAQLRTLVVTSFFKFSSLEITTSEFCLDLLLSLIKVLIDSSQVPTSERSDL